MSTARCNACKLEFGRDKASLGRHLDEVHVPSDGGQCYLCSAILWSPNALSRHLKKTHYGLPVQKNVKENGTACSSSMPWHC